MIEQFLQVALEFVKEIWFQLDSRFGLEETEAFKFIKPYLMQLQDNPTYLGISFAALIVIPYGLYKVRSIARERERKLDELMEEMEDEEEDEKEEYAEDDPRRLRRPEPAEEAREEDEEEDGDKPLFQDQSSPPYMKILEKLDEEEDEFELDTPESDVDKEMAGFELEPVSSELAESDIDKELNEFMEDEFELDKDQATKEDNDSTHDLAIKELQEEGELMELEGELPADDPFVNYSELDDEEQDRAIQELQDEMESTINKLTEQLEFNPDTSSSIKDLSDIHIGGNATIDEEYSLDEDFTDDSSSPEVEPLVEPELNQADFSLNSKPLELIDIEEPIIQKIEPIYEQHTSQPLQPVPERDYAIDEKGTGQADSLINRLKYFQEHLESKFHHGEKRELNLLPVQKPIAIDPVRERKIVTQRSYSSKPASVPVDSKKYMDMLESFIFLKDQDKRK